MTGQNVSRTKMMNKMKVLQCLLRDGTISRQQIAEMIKLTPATITNLTTELIADRWVRETGFIEEENRRAGRKHIGLELSGENKRAGGIHLGVDDVAFAEIDLKGNILKQHHYLVKERQPEQNYVQRLLEEAAVFFQDNNDGLSLIGVGVGCIGLVHPETGLLLRKAHWGWKENIQLASLLKGQITAPIYVDNNVRAMAIAEKMFGNGKHHSEFLFLYVGQGIGSGLIMGNKMYRSGLSGAGEFGHMTYLPYGEQCWCGNRGCLERYASHTAICKELRVSSMEEVLQAFDAGDESAAVMIQKAGERVGTVLASYLNMFYVPKVILGGILTDKRFPFLHAVRQEVAGRSFLAGHEGVEIEASGIGGRIGLLGSASMAFWNCMFSDE